MTRHRFFLPFGASLLVLLVCSCGTQPTETFDPTAVPVSLSEIPDGSTLLVRLVHLSDSHITDALSPGRLAKFKPLITSSWRPQEAYSTQVLDGLIRAVNAYHSQVAPIDALIHTGDAVDNDQKNELDWFMTVMDGGEVHPLSGPDDREPNSIPPVLMDPFHAFTAVGVYTQGRHGSGATIPWFSTIGNHESFAVGNFPVVEGLDGRRMGLVPLWLRPGIILPNVLFPDGAWAYGAMTTASEAPPCVFSVPEYVEPNPDRAFMLPEDILNRYAASSSQPVGHGFVTDAGLRSWYSRLIAPSIRLIVLDTTNVPGAGPGWFYVNGAISPDQLNWFVAELQGAKTRGEWVIVASHHPSSDLTDGASAIGPDDFRQLLNSYNNVVMHLAGHTHINAVNTWGGGYMEIVTGSTLDYPQTGRIIEVYRMPDGRFSLVLNPVSPLSSEDELLPLRRRAFDLSVEDAGSVGYGLPVATRYNTSHGQED